MIQLAPSISARIVIRSIALAIAYRGIEIVIGAIIDLRHHNASVVGLGFEFGFSGICLLVAFRGWFRRTAGAVRWLCVVAAFVAYFFVCTEIDAAFRRITGLPIFEVPTDQFGPHSGLVVNLFLLMLGVITFVLYRLLVGWLVPGLNLADDRTPAQRVRAIRWPISIMTFVVIAFGSELAGIVVGIEGSRPPEQEGWHILAPLAAIVILVAVYENVMSRGGRRTGETPEPTVPKTHWP
jgi:hypothetical protein